MAKTEKELEEEIIKKIGKYDFLNEIEIKEPKEPNIIDGKEYVIGFNLEEETNEYKNSLFKCTIDGQEEEIIMGVRYTEHVVDFVTEVELRIGDYWSYRNKDFKYYGLDDYIVLYDTVRHLLHKQIMDYFKETKREAAQHKYRVEIRFKTNKDGIQIVSQTVVRVS